MKGVATHGRMRPAVTRVLASRGRMGSPRVRDVRFAGARPIHRSTSPYKKHACIRRVSVDSLPRYIPACINASTGVSIRYLYVGHDRWCACRSCRDNQPLHLLVSFDRARRHGATADTPRRAREVLESFLEQLVERTWPRDEQRPVQTFYDKQVAMGPSHGPLVYVHPLGLYEEPPPKELEDCLVYRPTGIVRGPGRKGGEFTRRAEEDVEEDEAGKR